MNKRVADAVTRETAGRTAEIIARLKKTYPSAKIALAHSTPMELLVAVILSAQCTDERVNKVTPALFRKYSSADEFAGAAREDLEKKIYSTGFYRSKAANIIAAAKIIVEKHRGEVPRTMDELLALPGVARKTANIVLSNAYGIVEGIAVDTHVRRLSLRLGLSKNEDPEKIERDLMPVVPRSDWRSFSYLLQYHGRAVCKALKPDCPACVLAEICPSKRPARSKE